MRRKTGRELKKEETVVLNSNDVCVCSSAGDCYPQYSLVHSIKRDGNDVRNMSGQDQGYNRRVQQGSVRIDRGLVEGTSPYLDMNSSI